MSEDSLRYIKDLITEAHSGDKKQLEAIFSDAKRLIVEAPAGYGKTKTMVSKLAYFLASGGLPYPKRILGLTFGVNAAYKIKKDVAEQLPEMFFSGDLSPVKINERVFVTNYHGFCRHVLRLYGYLIHENFQNIDVFKSIGDSNIQELTNLGVGLSYDDAKEITDLSDAIKNVKGKYVNGNWRGYLSRVTTHLIPNNLITYNSIILYTLLIFEDYPELLKFYHKYFPIILVDEFQDTNIISFALLKNLISKETKAIFIGDGLQRIYGFIGAIRNLMSIAKENFDMEEIKLTTNYRFKDNPSMMLLDKNLRLVAENPADPEIDENSIIDLNINNDQTEEAQWVTDKTQNIIENDGSTKVAILVRSRTRNVQITIDYLEENEIDYFYGLYTDEDTDYIDFHKECYSSFIEQIKSKERISKLYMKQFFNKIKSEYKDKDSPMIQSLLVLLRLFLDRLVEHYKLLSNDDKISFVLDTFENKALKQQMEYVDKRVIVTTVHGAKGLEWDYVILSDMEQFVFPIYPSLCQVCINRYNSVSDSCCVLRYNKRIDRQFIEELSVFYVGVTRARKSVYFSSSRKRLNAAGVESNALVSCFLSLPGIEVRN